MSIPRSAATELLYGANVVLPALLAQQRKVVQAFVQTKDPEGIGKRRPSPRPEYVQILRLLKERNIPVQQKFQYEMNQMAENRPHNGLILEASPLKHRAMRALGPLGARSNECGGDPSQSYSIVGNNNAIIGHRRAPLDRPPLWVYLDGIHDPQNVGAILRTCNFLGVDGVAYPERDCPALTPTVSKASAGALELMSGTLFRVASGRQFLQACKLRSWEIVGAGRRPVNNGSDLSRPRILVLGNEHRGIRSSIVPLVDRFLWIRRTGAVRPSAEKTLALHDAESMHGILGCDEDLVGSLNVSVASGILLSHLFATAAAVQSGENGLILSE